jgi:hypothetical protein
MHRKVQYPYLEKHAASRHHSRGRHGKAWKGLLKEHPDRWFADFILRGIEHAFRIGFQGEAGIKLRSRMKNMVSATENPTVVSGYLDEELRQGRVTKVGSIEQAKTLKIHCSPFGGKIE